MELIKIPNKLLYTVSKEVTDIEKEVFPHLKEMIKIMKENKGVGLSAIQVGIPLRFFIMKGHVIINPVILKRQDKNFNSVEGCLSVDNYIKKVKRYKKIQLKFTNMEGGTEIKTFKKLDAAIVQHEIDHLNGITLNILK